MKDLVLEGFVNSFATERGLSNSPESEVFEAFVASSILRKYHQSDVTGMEDDTLVGGGGDGGIDAVVILVNGRPVSTEEGVQFFFDNHGRLDVDFVFVQAKSTAGFNAADIGNFAFGVEQFFSSVSNANVNITFNEEIQQKILLTRHIYGQSAKMREIPKCFLYYVTAGEWTESVDPRGRLDDGKTRLERLRLFSDVRVVPVDAELLKVIYRELERGVVKRVEFSKTASFPRIDRVGEAYIGLLPGDEFIKLISTDEGELNRELFYDNVRDFQGHNSVNREIQHTLADDQLRNSFPLLNNGVTIIARSIKRTADAFEIYDFQIVNGCQTAHILFQNKHVVGADTFIPVKLVVTDDSQVVNEVIKATNRQTPVLSESLESLSPFHRELEDLYNIRESGKISSERIYYERRSKQYAMDNILPANIVTLTGQIKAFIGMFLNEPHSHPRYYGELLKSYEGRIFVADHKPEPYYAGGVSLLLVERWLNSRPSDRELRPYKHQLLMLLRVLISGVNMPRLNSNGISAYSLRIVDVLRDPSRGHTELSKATELLRASLGKFQTSNVGRLNDTQRNPPHRLRAFTEQLQQDMRVGQTVPPRRAPERSISPGTTARGAIKFFDDVKKYGFIRSRSGQDVFVHESEITAIPYHLRIAGMEVIYRVEEDPRSPGMLMACAVRLTPK